MIRKKDGTVRVVQDFRGLNAALEFQSGALGILMHIIDEAEESTCFSCIDLAPGFLRLEIHDDSEQLTALRNEDRKLREYIQCGFGLKTVVSAFTNCVGGN